LGTGETGYGIRCIHDVLRALEIRSWEKLKGTPVRIKRKDDRIVAIGHYLKDEWVSFQGLAQEQQQ
jgi:hypothetical protein